MSAPTPDITLYTFGTPNGFKASVTLEELGIPYKAEIINISQNTQKEPWFLEINPNGRIPAIKDGELRVFETGAIMLYVTEKYDKENKISFPYGSDEYWEMMSWLMFQMGGVGPMQGQANHFIAMAKVKSEYGIERYVEETKRLYSVLESRLKDHDWLVDNKYSLADIANFCWVRAAYMIEIDLNQFPGVKKWVDRIEAREAVQKGVKVGAMKSPEEMKEMFAGMRAKIAAMNNSDKH
ncbi:glutathione transferase [Cystobasidium minutum MCA 4210]|uniref:glutathione transferase n=1 Tax=Cystobasidium minutum MCA 4210 TaxID=1397322 RepID=UPI0034CD2B99|eukprot:jgi/Rhomi1/166302/fgenesh1_kg.1_\